MCLASDRLRKERLTSAWRTHEERTLGDLTAQLGVFVRVLEELDNLLQLLLSFVKPSHIVKGDV